MLQVHIWWCCCAEALAKATALWGRSVGGKISLILGSVIQGRGRSLARNPDSKGGAGAEARSPNMEEFGGIRRCSPRVEMAFDSGVSQAGAVL